MDNELPQSIRMYVLDALMAQNGKVIDSALIQQITAELVDRLRDLFLQVQSSD